MKYIIKDEQDGRYFSDEHPLTESSIGPNHFDAWIGNARVFDSECDASDLMKSVRYPEFLTVVPIHG